MGNSKRVRVVAFDMKQMATRWIRTLVLASLALAALGGLVLADPFDRNDYDSCPSSQRLEGVTGLDVARTDNADEIQVSWDALSADTLGLGSLTFNTVITVIVEDDDNNHKITSVNKALGTTSVTLEDIDLARDLDVSVALTYGDHVISDIVSKAFTSGLEGPQFYGSFYRIGAVPAGGVIAGTAPLMVASPATMTQGRFYYLGFGEAFGEVEGGSGTASRFRVGLRHGSGEKPDDADFDHFRLRIENSQGDDLLGYDARTLGGDYNMRVLTVGSLTEEEDGTLILATDPNFDSYSFSNIHEANTLNSDAAPFVSVPSIRAAGVLELRGLAAEMEVDVATLQFAPGPDGYYELPDDIFDLDGSYTITAWAEDEDNHQISPTSAITFNVQRGMAAGRDRLTLAIVSGPDRSKLNTRAPGMTAPPAPTPGPTPTDTDTGTDGDTGTGDRERAAG